MPGFNQKGPMGDGPMTGRRMGRCTNFGANETKQTENPSNSENDPFFDRGQGRGRGGGRGMGRGKGMGGGRGMGRERQNRFRGGQ